MSELFFDQQIQVGIVQERMKSYRTMLENLEKERTQLEKNCADYKSASDSLKSELTELVWEHNIYGAIQHAANSLVDPDDDPVEIPQQVLQQIMEFVNGPKGADFFEELTFHNQYKAPTMVVSNSGKTVTSTRPNGYQQQGGFGGGGFSATPNQAVSLAGEGFTSGVHRWRVRFDKMSANQQQGYIFIGVAFGHMAPGGQPIPSNINLRTVSGLDNNCAGWDVTMNKMKQFNVRTTMTPPGTLPRPTVGDVVEVKLDMDKRRVSFRLTNAEDGGGEWLAEHVNIIPGGGASGFGHPGGAAFGHAYTRPLFPVFNTLSARDQLTLID